MKKKGRYEGKGKGKEREGNNERTKRRKREQDYFYAYNPLRQKEINLPPCHIQVENVH